MTKKLHVTLSVLRAMEEQGILVIESQDASSKSGMLPKDRRKKDEFTKEQEQAVSASYKIMRKVIERLVSCLWSDRKWKNRSVYENDPACC